MIAVVIHNDQKAYIEDLAKPVLNHDDEVLIKVAYSGLCGSDIPRVFHEGAHFYPIILGHEFSGIVAQKGTSVTHINIGDKVCCAPLTPCFKCNECEHGLYSLCKQYGFIGSRSQGGNAQYVVVKSCNAFKLPESFSLKAGAFLEPITVGLHAILLAGGCDQKNVIIVGAGTIGLLALQSAKALGAKSVTVIDINSEKLILAEQLGANNTFNSLEMSAQDIASLLHAQRFNQLILETAGSPLSVLMCLEISGPRAVISMIGTLHQPLILSDKQFGLILRKEITISGSWMNYSEGYPGQEWDIASRLLENDQIKLTPLIASCSAPAQFAAEVNLLAGCAMNGKLLLDFT